MRTLSLLPRLAWPLSLLLAAALLGAVAFLIALPATTAQAQEPPAEEEGPPPGSPPPVPPLPIDGGVTGTQGLPTPPRPIFNSVTPTGPTSVTVTFWPQNGVRIYTVSYRRNRLPELFRNKSEPVTSSGLTTVVVTGLQCGVEYEFWGWSFGDGTTTASAFNDRPATGPLLATPACAPPPDQRGAVTLSDTTPQVGTAVTATLTDPDRGITNLTWQWQRLVTGWGDIAGARSSSYTPVSADFGYRLRAIASYTDGHGTGKRATSAASDAVVDPTPPMPTRLTATATGSTMIDLVWSSPSGIARHEVQRREGAAGPWVTVSANIQGRSYTVTGLKPNTAYSFVVRAYGDGTTFADAWGPYSLLVTVTTLPPAPTGLRANGNLIDDTNDGVRDKITLRWEPVQGATSYNVHYVEEVCARGVGCAPVGGLANPSWQLQPDIATIGSTVIEATLGKLTPKTLYRVEVQAVNVRNEGSAWSMHAYVYPTSSPLTATTNVALMDIHSFQADGQDAGSYKYTICLDDPMTISNPMNPAISGAWTVTDIIAEIKAAAETWETAIGDSSILSMTADPETSPGKCEDPGMPSTRNQVIFLDDNMMDMKCPPRALGCWKNLGGDLSRGQAFDKQSLILRASGGGRDWDTMTNGCSRLRTVVAHEVGHALGIDHPDIGASVRKMYLMYGRFHGLCRPQPYDVVAAMVNYQSR